MKLEKFFIEEYLTPGQTRDNYIITNYPIELLQSTPDIIKQQQSTFKPCNIVITREEEKAIETTINTFPEQFIRDILARDYVCALIYHKLSQIVPIKPSQQQIINDQLHAFLNNDHEAVKELHPHSIMPFDIDKHIKKTGNIELNIFLHNTENVDIQRAINLFISSRTPYSIKIFTNNERLPSYADSMGTLIESPHDFLTMNTNTIINDSPSYEK